MATIREDLDGVTVVPGGDGLIVLQAGDVVPEGVSVGDHLLEPEPESEPEPEAKPRTRTKRQAST